MPGKREYPAAFQRNRKVRNFFSLRLSGILTIAFFPTFFILDLYAVPDHLMLTAGLRTFCTLLATFVIWATYKRRRWAMERTTPLTFALALSLTGSISMMSWAQRGFESPYYAGINTVLIVVTLMFSWTRREALLFHSLVYGFYISPLLLGFLKFQDVGTALGNQFFLLTTQILTFISQDLRVASEIRELGQRHTLRRYLSKMRHLAITDSLTGLFNRRHLLDVGEREFRRCLRYDRPFAAVMVDIDWFKKVNDTYSHRVGDEVIQQVAKRLHSNLRSIDIIGRYGGEEFLILLPETDDKRAMEFVTARLQQAIRNGPVATSAGPLKITLSLGVSDNEDRQTTLAQLIHRADIALYEAKRAGRNREVKWLPEMEKLTLAA